MSFILLPILLLVLAGMLIVRGWRGTRVGDHPLCQACGFDLFGRPEGTELCSECGADLKKPAALRIGHHYRRRTPLAIGLTLLAVDSIGLGLFFYGRAEQVNWWPYAPLWYVLRESTVSGSLRQSPAIAELSKRCLDVKASAADCKRILDAALDYQGTSSKVWNDDWGSLIESADDSHLLSNEQWTRYLKQAWDSCAISRVRQRVTIGHPLPFEVELGSARVPVHSELRGDFAAWHVRWPGAPAKDYPGGGLTLGFSSHGGVGTCGGRAEPAEFLPGLVPGEQQVEVVAKITMGQKHAGDSFKVDRANESLAVFPCKFLLLPADQSSVRLIKDPSLAEAIRKCTRVDAYQANGHSTIDVDISLPPVGVSFQVYVNGRAVEDLEGLVCRQGKQEGHLRALSDIPSGGHLNVRLRSEPKFAARTVDADECWDGEIEFKDVMMH